MCDKNECRYLNGEDCHLHMPYKKTLDSAQGMAIWEDEAYILFHTGLCSVYDLVTREQEPIASFRLGSFNDGVPSDEYCNHANQAMFSGFHYQNNPIPLLYVTIGNSGGADQEGYYYRCAVENIIKKGKETGEISYTSQTVQTIVYKDQGIEEVPWERPCWGAPAFFVDSENRALYIFSARYRTTKSQLKQYDKNVFIITKFSLPDVEANSRINIMATDIIDQFVTPFDILFTQGGTLYGDKIYYTFGYGNQDYPLGIRVFDLVRRCISVKVDLSGTEFAHEEIECCAFYRGKLLCNTNSGNIYSVQEGVFSL